MPAANFALGNVWPLGLGCRSGLGVTGHEFVVMMGGYYAKIINCGIVVDIGVDGV